MTDTQQTAETFETWAILELMGHRRMAGKVREQEVFGTNLCRIDVYKGADSEPSMTQLYSASALYCVTPCSEEIARRYAARYDDSGPVARWELPPPAEDDGDLEDIPY